MLGRVLRALIRVERLDHGPLRLQRRVLVEEGQRHQRLAQVPQVASREAVGDRLRQGLVLEADQVLQEGQVIRRGRCWARRGVPGGDVDRHGELDEPEEAGVIPGSQVGLPPEYVDIHGI
jgi:hypothetical protein